MGMLGYTWQEVADAIGVSQTTLWRHSGEKRGGGSYSQP